MPRTIRSKTGTPSENLLRYLGPEPLAPKVPEITLMFWVIKILTTGMGESTSDYLAHGNILAGGAIETVILAAALWWQFRTRRYYAPAYWFLAAAIAIFGTGVADALHRGLGVPYTGTTVLWALALGLVFWQWHRREGTLSIHSITTRRREAYYWTTVFATFALGTATGDLTAFTMHLGFLASGITFGVVILIPAVAWWRFQVNAVAAFWFAYIVTRPLGASFADYASKPHALSGLDFGDGPTSAVAAIVLVVLVASVAVAGHGLLPAGRARPSPPTPENVAGRPQ